MAARPGHCPVPCRNSRSRGCQPSVALTEFLLLPNPSPGAPGQAGPSSSRAESRAEGGTWNWECWEGRAAASWLCPAHFPAPLPGLYGTPGRQSEGAECSCASPAHLAAAAAMWPVTMELKMPLFPLLTSLLSPRGSCWLPCEHPRGWGTWQRQQGLCSVRGASGAWCSPCAR